MTEKKRKEKKRKETWQYLSSACSSSWHKRYLDFNLAFSR
jgi:hypothetical protein